MHYLQTAQMPGEVHREFTNLLCHKALHGAINHALNLPVSLSNGKPASGASSLTHLMKISSNWPTLITPRNAICNYHGSGSSCLQGCAVASPSTDRGAHGGPPGLRAQGPLGHLENPEKAFWEEEQGLG